MSGAVVHRKLVRDRIPEIIAANGGAVSVRVMDQDEYRAALHTKLGEEAAELRAAEPREQLGELADLLDVVQALAADAGHTLDDVIAAAASKTRKRGGFAGRLWLEWTRG